MRTGQWMTKDPRTVGPKETIVEARAIMRQRGIRRLPVVEGEHLVGVVTDRDLRSAWASDATTLTAQELQYLLVRIPVRDVMTSPVVTVAPETPLDEAVTLMREKKIGGLPVLRGGRLVGILTETDVFRAFAQVLHTGNLEGRLDSKPPGSAAGKVLVPVLGTSLSGKVVQEACLLAAQFGVHPKVLLIMDSSTRLEELRRWEDTRTFDEIVAGHLADYRSIADSMGVKIETGFRSDDPATTALEEIATGAYDFVVLGRRNPLHLVSSRLELEKTGFAAKVMEASPIPVLVVGEAAQLEPSEDKGMKAEKTVPGIHSATFWCREKDQVVTVEFECKGSFLFRRDTEILSCSAFEDPAQINCRRRCLDPAYRALIPDWQIWGY